MKVMLLLVLEQKAHTLQLSTTLMLYGAQGVRKHVLQELHCLEVPQDGGTANNTTSLVLTSDCRCTVQQHKIESLTIGVCAFVGGEQEGGGKGR